MFTQEDLQGLEETFAAARAYVVTTQPKNREALAVLLNFENTLTTKISDNLTEEEAPIEKAEEVTASED